MVDAPWIQRLLQGQLVRGSQPKFKILPAVTVLSNYLSTSITQAPILGRKNSSYTLCHMPLSSIPVPCSRLTFLCSTYRPHLSQERKNVTLFNAVALNIFAVRHPPGLMPRGMVAPSPLYALLFGLYDGEYPSSHNKHRASAVKSTLDVFSSTPTAGHETIVRRLLSDPTIPRATVLAWCA